MIKTFIVAQVFDGAHYSGKVKLKKTINGFKDKEDTAIIIFGHYQKKCVEPAVEQLTEAGYKVLFQSPIAMNHEYGGESRNTVVVFEK